MPSENTVLAPTILLFVVGCTLRPPVADAEVCGDGRADWILQCIEKANPHSDEEPEDNTAQCERTAMHLFCGDSCARFSDGSMRCWNETEATDETP